MLSIGSWTPGSGVLSVVQTAHRQPGNVVPLRPVKTVRQDCQWWLHAVHSVPCEHRVIGHCPVCSRTERASRRSLRRLHHRHPHHRRHRPRHHPSNSVHDQATPHRHCHLRKNHRRCWCYHLRRPQPANEAMRINDLPFLLTIHNAISTSSRGAHPQEVHRNFSKPCCQMHCTTERRA